MCTYSARYYVDGRAKKRDRRRDNCADALLCDRFLAAGRRVSRLPSQGRPETRARPQPAGRTAGRGHFDPVPCAESPTARSPPHPRNTGLHFVDGKEHERISEKPVECVRQIVERKAACTLDMVAKPENAMNLDSKRACASPELLVAGQQHGARGRLRQGQTETVIG